MNSATGFATETETRHGRFLIEGLQLGGPYVVVVRRIGFVPQQTEPLLLRLGEPLELAFILRPAAATPLDTVVVTANAATTVARVRADPGLGTTISDSLLHRLPTLNRDIVDFVRLAPQVSTKVQLPSGGMSGGGMNARLNNFLLDGVPERFISPNTPLSWGFGRSIPIDAVQEYQVLLTPFDARYGDFAGGLVNTVTQSGTNLFHGSALAYVRSDRLARGGTTAIPYQQGQFGFSPGGPIVRDRVHFFIAPEIQRSTTSAEGPYVGQPAEATPAVPVDPAVIERFKALMLVKGLDIGSGGAVKNRDPLTNVFARLDAAIPAWNSQVVASLNYGEQRNQSFSRANLDTVSLSSYQITVPARSRLASLRLETGLRRAGGGQNELTLSQQATGGDRLSDVRQPVVQVTVDKLGGQGNVTLKSGTHETAQGTHARARTIRLADDLTLPLGAAHVLTLGVAAEHFRIDRGGVPNAYGNWTFVSLDSLEQGIAHLFLMSQDFGSATVPLPGRQYGAYAGDQWRLGQRLSLTLGLRADLMTLSDTAPYNVTVDTIFQRRTNQMPRQPVYLSPRIGFSWAVSASRRDELRGGVGIFTARPPLFWIHPALYSYGFGTGTRRCGEPNGTGPAPAFVPDYRAVPTSCAGGPELSTTQRGDVDLLDPGLHLAQTLRASLAYDQRLPWDLSATSEVLFTRNLADFVFVNLNLPGPQAIDRHGRVLYGTLFADGTAVTAQRPSRFSEVIDLTNTSRNYSYQLSQRLEKRFSHGLAGTVSYTYSRVRDVQSPYRAGGPGRDIWAQAGAVSGRHDSLPLGISANDVPHRVVLAVTYTAPWRRWTTTLSFYYIGESGSPFTYVTGGSGGRGDLNADGSNANDPIYVPVSALDTSEIRFSGLSDSVGADNSPVAQGLRVGRQQQGFEGLIQRMPCLARQRGRIMERNSCREPFSHTTTASVRQTIPAAGGALEAELDVFNVLNLLNRDWGLYRVSAPALLNQVSQPPGADLSQPAFVFDTTRPDWTIVRAQSAFQLQLALRYRF